MVAHAKAHESDEDARTYQEKQDDEAKRFRGSFSGYEHNKLFVGCGPGKKYLEAGYVTDSDYDEDGRAVAPFDMDGDGDQDLALMSLQSLRVLQNDAGAGAHWVRLSLRATASEPLALGAVVKVRAGGHSQVDRVRLTMGFHTQVSPNLHFGLGAATEVEFVEVRWPSGRVERFTGVPPDQRVQLVEGTAQATVLPRTAWPVETRPLPRLDYSLGLAASDRDGRSAALGRPGRSTVVNFWAPWCEACTRELPALSALAKRRNDADFVAVSVEINDIKGALDFAEAQQLTMDLRFANDRVIKAFFGKEGRMRLPATFVFGPDQRLRRAFHHEVGADDVAALLDAIHTAPTIADYKSIMGVLFREGRMDEARRMMNDAAARVSRGDAFSRTRLAELHLFMEDREVALGLLKAELKKDPDDADTWALMSEALGTGGDHDGALAAARRALEIAPRNQRALNNLGMALWKKGDLKGAAKAFRDTLDVAPSFEVARKNLKKIEAALGE